MNKMIIYYCYYYHPKNPTLNFRALRISKKLNDISQKIKTLYINQFYETDVMYTVIVLNTQKNPYLNQATQKILVKFSFPKKSQNQKFQTPKNPSITPGT